MARKTHHKHSRLGHLTLSDLGKHAVGWGIGCDKVPDGQEGSDWTSRRVRITTNRPMRSFDSQTLFASVCSHSDTVIDSPTGGVSLSDGIGETGRIAFKHTLACGGKDGVSFTAQYTLVDSNQGEHTFQVPVRGPCAGDITLKGVPRGCTSRSFKVKATVPAALGRLLIDFTYGGNNERFIAVELARSGKSPKQLGFFLLRDFSVKIPARGLRAGKYSLRVGLETDSPDDYPNATVHFKRC